MHPTSRSTRHSEATGRRSVTHAVPSFSRRFRTSTRPPASSSRGSPCAEDPPRALDVLLEPAVVLVPRPGEIVRHAPVSGALAIESDLAKCVEPARDIRRVAQERARLELALADERLRVDDEPGLPLRSQDVPAVEVLVHQARPGAVDASVDVDRRVEQRALERRAGLRVPAWDFVCPPIRLVGEERERMIRPDLDL